MTTEKTPLQLLPPRRGMNDKALAQFRKTLDKLWEAANSGTMDSFTCQAVGPDLDLVAIVAGESFDHMAHIGQMFRHTVQIMIEPDAGDAV